MYLYFLRFDRLIYIFEPDSCPICWSYSKAKTHRIPSNPSSLFLNRNSRRGVPPGAYIRPRLAISYTAGSLQFPYIKLLWKIPNLTTRQYLPQLKQHPSGGTQWFTMHAFHRGIWYCVPPFLLFNRKLSRTMWRLALTVPYSKKLTFKWTSR